MKHSITVVNLRHVKNPDFRVDRSSVLGNPFRMTSEADRSRVCDAYETWLADKIAAKDPRICAALNEIWQAARTRDISLGCWCAPNRCHADSIRNVILSHL